MVVTYEGKRQDKYKDIYKFVQATDSHLDIESLNWDALRTWLEKGVEEIPEEFSWCQPKDAVTTRYIL